MSLIHPDWPKFRISHKVGGCQNSDGRNTWCCKWQGSAEVGISHAAVITQICWPPWLWLFGARPFCTTPPKALSLGHHRAVVTSSKHKVSLNFQSASWDLNWDVFAFFYWDSGKIGHHLFLLSSDCWIFPMLGCPLRPSCSCWSIWFWAISHVTWGGILEQQRASIHLASCRKKKRSFTRYCAHLKHS